MNMKIMMILQDGFACQHIVPSCASLESIIESISETHLVSVLDDAFNNWFTRENIRKLCYQIYIQTKNETVGAVGSQSYVCRLSLNVQRFKRTLLEETLSKTARHLGTKICSGILHHMESMVQEKLKEDLTRLKFSDETHEGRPSDETHERRPRFQFSDETDERRPRFQFFDETDERIPRFQFSEQMHERIEFSIRAIIISVIATAAGFIISIGVFFITIIYPVDINSKEWRKQIADEVFDKIRASRSTLKANILEEMKNVCSNTLDDLNNILTNLKEFKSELSPMDQIKCKYP